MRKGKGQLTHKQSWDMMKMENRSLRRRVAEQKEDIKHLEYLLAVANGKLMKYALLEKGACGDA